MKTNINTHNSMVHARKLEAARKTFIEKIRYNMTSEEILSVALGERDFTYFMTLEESLEWAMLEMGII